MILLLISLLIVIIIHEAAHLIVAKRVGCDVEVFSVGFGTPIWKKKIGNTQYQFTPFLLGGYCKLKGELEISNDKSAFTNLRYRDKLAIVLAGVTVNIVIGILTFILGKILHCYELRYFGYISFLIGLTNALPIPALDGSYPILLVLEKIYGKEKGNKIIGIIMRLGFVILMGLMAIILINYVINSIF